MEPYKNSKICKGFGCEYKPCDYIDTCKIRTNYAFDTRQGNNNELYCVFGYAVSCKRDNPNFKPYTVKEFMEKYGAEDNSEMEKVLTELRRLEIVK